MFDMILLLQGNKIDYHDFIGITTLLIINSTISFIEENNTGNVAAVLMARLAPKAKLCPLHKFIEQTISLLLEYFSIFPDFYFQLLGSKRWEMD